MYIIMCAFVGSTLDEDPLWQNVNPYYILIQFE
jgi:hypothetical protein